MVKYGTLIIAPLIEGRTSMNVSQLLLIGGLLIAVVLILFLPTLRSQTKAVTR